MRIFIFIGFLFCILSVNSQKIKNTFSNARINCEYETENGKLNGSYVSKYGNGTKRAEGNFKNNVRSGIWTVYDSTGRKIHQRNYSNHLIYERTYPEKEKNGAANLFDTLFYQLKYNQEGFIDYSTLMERMVVFESRLWRELKKETNPLLFKKNLLYKTIYAHLSDSLSKSFCSSDDKFMNQLSRKDLVKFNERNYSIISYKIKEDSFYDIERCVFETRIIGICPVGINKSTKDTSDLFWVYYPYERSAWAKVKLKGKGISDNVKTMDDLFFFRDFSSEIYKLSNAKGLALSDYCKTSEQIKSEQQRIEISLIEVEHEIWLGNLPD